MQKYITLLRGINVGGKNKVSMKELKSIFESLGYVKVITYINSGNIIFETNSQPIEELTKTIEITLEKHYLFKIKTLIITADDLLNISKKVPLNWKNDTEQRTDVMFLWKEFNNKETIKLIRTNPDVDNLEYINGAIVWNIKRKNYTKSGMNKLIGTTVYKNMTTRNINTVRKLVELLNKN